MPARRPRARLPPVPTQMERRIPRFGTPQVVPEYVAQAIGEFPFRLRGFRGGWVRIAHYCHYGRGWVAA